MVSIGGCRVFFASSTISFWSINSKILLAQARAFCNSTITELSSLNGFENWEAYDKRVDKLPIVIAGGSFNSQGVVTKLCRNAKICMKELIEELDENKVYFLIGHKMQGYEKALIDTIKKSNKNFEN